MTDSETRFAERAVRRKRLFLGLAIAGLVLSAVWVVLWVALIAIAVATAPSSGGG